MGIEQRKLKSGNRFRAFIYVRDADGKRLKINGSDKILKKEAQEDFERMIKDKGIGRIITSDKRTTFKELAENWFQSRILKGIEVSTKNHYRSILNKYLYPEIKMIKVTQINPEFLERVFTKIKKIQIKKNTSNGIVESQISPKQYNHVVSTVRAIFNYGVTRRMCDYNPALAVDKIRIPTQLFTYLYPNEVVKFLSYVKNKQSKYIVPYYVYLLGFNLGLRIGELIALKWEHIDFEKKSIMICDAYDKQAYRIKNYPKSKKYRILWMNQTVENALLDLRSVYKDSKYVFMNPGCTNHLYYRNFRCRSFVKDAKESGVSHFDLHGMRHTFAISYLLNGGNAHDLQLILGHENISTTMRYVKFTDEYLKSKSGIVNFDASESENVTKISDYLKSRS